MNSTECPKNGLRCKPEMKPVTTCLARRSSWEMRAMVSGCRKRRGASFFLATMFFSRCRSLVGMTGEGENEGRGERKMGIDCVLPISLSPILPFSLSPLLASRGENLLEALVLGQLAFLGRRVAHNAVDDLVGGDAFGRGGEVREDAVPQDGQRQGLDVVGLHVRSAFQERPRLATEDEVLRGAWAGA